MRVAWKTRVTLEASVTRMTRTTGKTRVTTRATTKNLALIDKLGKKKDPDHKDGPLTIKTISMVASGFPDQAQENGLRPLLYSKPSPNLEDNDTQDDKIVCRGI